MELTLNQLLAFLATALAAELERLKPPTPKADDRAITGMLTVGEVAKLLTVSPATVRQHIRAGELRAVNLNKKRKNMRPLYAIVPADLYEFIDKRRG